MQIDPQILQDLEVQYPTMSRSEIIRLCMEYARSNLRRWKEVVADDPEAANAAYATAAQVELARHELLVDLARLKYEAGVLGMWRTMHAVDIAAGAAGWELAELLQPNAP